MDRPGKASIGIRLMKGVSKMEKQENAFGHRCEHEILDRFGEEQREKWRFRFKNGYGASVIKREHDEIYKVAIIGKNGCIDFDNPMTCGKPDWICIGEIGVRAYLNRIASLVILLFVLSLSSGCASVQAIKVCSVPNPETHSSTCATGYYDNDGSIVTAAHAFLEGTPVDIQTEIGYTDRAVVLSHTGIDTAVVVGEPYYSDACYTNADAEDSVMIAVYKGVVIGTVEAVREFGYIVDTNGVVLGDSGSAVIARNGCIIGQVMGIYDGAVVVVKTHKN